MAGRDGETGMAARVRCTDVSFSVPDLEGAEADTRSAQSVAARRVESTSGSPDGYGVNKGLSLSGGAQSIDVPVMRLGST
jgi:hypothetical protein